MRIIASLIFIAAVSLTPAIAADFLDMSIDGAWVKVQGKDDLTQWSTISSKHPKTRIDFIHVRDEDGSWYNYYLVRSACPNDSQHVAVYKFNPGDQLGLGMDCNGAIVSYTTAPVLDEVQKLPSEAAALLKH